MKPEITLIDYGIGNLFSVRRALEHCGADVVVADAPALIAKASRLVLPGVGAFADGMQGLAAKGLDQAVLEFAASGRPLLGICLGMQMLATVSEEFGEHEGLGIIPGKVVAIPAIGADGRPHKIPHVGWASLEMPDSLPEWEGSILADVKSGDAVYLVHSYTMLPDNPAYRLADCHYDGRLIAAAVRKGNVYGCQFHPEKSGPVGLAILKRFIQADKI